jgi:hypothetical protein
LDEVENPSIFKTGRSHPNTPLPAPLAAAPYRASDLVPWTKADKAGFWPAMVCPLLTRLGHGVCIATVEAMLPVGPMQRRMSATAAEQRTMVGSGAEVIKFSKFESLSTCC